MPPERRHVSVLVVDDDRDIREILDEVLTDAGYSVVGASNGVEALTCLGKCEPELILLDLNMPVMTGQQFRARQLATPEIASIPTVVMTAVDRPDERTRELHASEVLAKPVELRQILATVARYCRT